MRLVAENLVKVYGDRVRTVALNGFGYTFHPGRCYAVVGPSGSGKSTLLYLLAGVETPTSGRVLLGDTVLSSLSDDERARLRALHFGFVFQRFYLLPYLNAADNLNVGLYLKTGRTDARRAAELLRTLGIEDPYRLPHEYSGGEQQRIAIARALMKDPAILLADEPTGNLDSANSRQIFRILKDVARAGRTVIVATHDADMAATCDVILRLRDGRLSGDHGL
ncbi:MAG: ABC transporter ATP-binding protein [Thermotogae bacterium]|nr:ABC transporter ATP-binding protein [Thermotogota bacterium]